MHTTSIAAALFALIVGAHAHAAGLGPRQAETVATITVTKAGSATGTVTASAGLINCGAVCSDSYSNGAMLTLTATPAGGNQLTGWLGRCTGTGPCQFIVDGNASATATFAPAALGTPTLDIDGNGTFDSLTDGLLTLRFLFGLSDAALINGVLGAGATRTTASAINTYLDDIRPALDIDGNGQVDALTDGLLIIRYLFGLRGSSLIAGAVAADGTRNTAMAIEAQIGGLVVSAGPGFALTTSLAGLGSGIVTSVPAGIACGALCSAQFSAGTPVTLSAAATADSTFAGWGGACSGTGGCTVTMSAARDVSATFTLNATVVPPADPTQPANIFDTTAFLYGGANPLQTGVVPGSITAGRVAVLRGTVHGRDGAPITGVAISILGHPEFGQTLSRGGGAFDMAVNGGGLLTVRYQKAGFPDVQRALVVPWRDYAWLPDVVMIPYDTAVTVVDLTAPTLHAARGNPVTDADGTRRATILFLAGTTATMVMPDGSTQPLTAMSVRATEYTVGASGPSAMPAALPPGSGYTYALELSVDEAVAAGAVEVQFSQPAPFYLENFLGFPVGNGVPSGYYDRVKGQWIASTNGRVVKVLSITSGMANLDITGTGIAANASALAALGITDAERTQVALLYAPGQSLWRVPVAHFTPRDYNYANGPPPDAINPPSGGGGGDGGGGGPPRGSGNGKPKKPAGTPDKKCGSVIGCDSQTLGESVPVAGTSLRLHYKSDRTPGRKDAFLLKIPVSDGRTIPSSMRSMHVAIYIAGRAFRQSFAPGPNVEWHMTWDGRDGYGRPVYGVQRAYIKVGYDYVPQYYTSADDQYNAFARAEAGGSPIGITREGYFTLSSEYTELVGIFDARSLGTGGWSLTNHHGYDPLARTLYLGDGNERGANSLSSIISTVAGDGTDGSSGDNGPAIKAKLKSPWGIATGPDGSLYIADLGNFRIRRVGPDGIITSVAGNGAFGFTGDGGQATAATLGAPISIAVAQDGSLLIPDRGNQRIRRVGLDGIITTVAGTGVPGFNGDGGPATAARLSTPYSVAGGPNGSIYIWDADNYRVRRVGSDGIINTIAGTGVIGTSGTNGDGGRATSAAISASYEALNVGPDGTIVVADTGYNRIRKISPDGIITLVGGSFPGFSGDGGPALTALMWRPERALLAPDGTIFVADAQNNRIRRIGTDGVITTVAGNGSATFSGDGGPATAAGLGSLFGMALGPDGTLYLSDQTNHRIRAIRSAAPDLSAGESLFASDDGFELYVFNSGGHHIKTLDALTGTIREQFGYDLAGYLISITDAGGNLTTIQRNGAVVTAIVAPGGEVTTLVVNADGWLQSATGPAGGAHVMTYSPDGLLNSLADPRAKVHQYQYDPVGRLTSDQNPAGGTSTLARIDLSEYHYKVTVTTALGLVTTYEVEELLGGDTRRVQIDPSGAVTESLIRRDGSRHTIYPDGTIEDIAFGPDPRFGMESPFVKSQTITTPGGPTTTRTATRVATLSTPGNLLSLSTLTDTVTLNGKVFTRTYDAATRKLTSTTPMGRMSSVTLDNQGRIVAVQPDATFGLAPYQTVFDVKGRLSQLSRGTQSWTYGYDAQSRLISRTDAAGGSLGFGYDADQRRNQITLPSGRVYNFAHDASGNLTQVTMPSMSVHGLGYNAVDKFASYTPPGNAAYATTRDADGRMTQVTLPGGRTEVFGYDSKNRSSTLVYPEASVAVTYTPANLTSRIDTLTRTPATGSAQQTAFSYAGSLVTGASWAGAAQGQFAYAYNSSFLLQSMALTSGLDSVTTLLTRDNDGLLTGVGPFTYTRAGPAGAPSELGDGTVAVALAYDTLARVQNRTHTVGGQQKYAVQLTRDNVGRIAARVETVAGVAVNWAYTYDADSQLTQVQRNGVVVELYGYDANRNRVSRQLGNNAAEAATYDAQDRLLQQAGLAYQFNADGYLTQRGADTFQYSATGELLQAAPGGQTITYAYDGLRRRTSRTDVNGTAQYLYGNPENSLQVTHARSAAGVLTTLYYDEGRRLFALERGGNRFYVATDSLGSPRVITDAAGALVRVVEYDHYGGVVQDSNPAFDLPIGYAGGLADSATGLVRFGIRDYDPVAGRWTARDPALFDGNQSNLYAYVGNNPVNLVDPAGLTSGGVGLCEGVCVGIKLGVDRDADGKWSISACVEAGFGVGNSLDFDPFGKTDDTGFSAEEKVALKAGIAKLELGVDVDDCGDFKPKAEVCAGPFCVNPAKDEAKASLDLDEEAKLKNPFKGAGFGVEGKLVVKNCQQAKW